MTTHDQPDANVAAATATAPTSDILVLPPDPEAGFEGAPTMNRRRAAVRGALGAVPSPSVYRNRLPAPAGGGGASPPLAAPADVLAVHTALHIAGRAAIVRPAPASARGGWFLVAAPKAAPGGGGGGGGGGLAASSTQNAAQPSGAVPRAAPAAGAGDILDIGQAAWAGAGGSEAAVGALFPPAWEVVTPVSTSTPHLTPAALAALAALAPGGTDRPYVVLALVDRDGTVGFSRLYAGIRPPDGAPPRAVGGEDEDGGGGGDGSGGSDEDEAAAPEAGGGKNGGRGRGRGRGRGGSAGGRGRGPRGRGRRGR